MHVRGVPIPTRLRAAFAFLALLLLLGSSIGLWHYRNVSLLASRMSGAQLRLETALRLNNYLLTLLSDLHQSADKQDAAAFRGTATRLVADFKSQTASILPAIEEIAHENDRRSTLAASVLALVDAMPRRVGSLIDLADQNDWTVIHSRLLNQADQTDHIVAALMNLLESDLSEERKLVAADTATAQRRAFLTLGVTAGLSVVIALLLAGIVTHSVKAPLDRLSAGARALAAGDFHHRIPVDGKDELTELANAFNTMTSELEDLFSELQHEKGVNESRARELARANADLEQFAYSASHDLQEPLRMITLYSQLLHRKWKRGANPEVDEYVDTLFRSAQHMQQLISDLLAFTRAGNIHPGDDAADVNAVLERVLGMMRVEIADQKCTVRAQPLPMLQVHETHIQQLLQNLIGNAIKYRSEERVPEIDIRANRRGQMWEFAVQDNGIGIEKEYTTQIFGMFKRLHSKRYPGTGIGLAICQRIVEGYGGEIWVESEVGHSSTFYFTLPGVDGAV